MMKKTIFVSLLSCVLSVVSAAQPKTFPIAKGNKSVSCILYSNEGPKLDSVAAHLLALDIERVTSVRPQVFTNFDSASGNVIIVGNISSPLVTKFIGKTSPLVQQIQNQWECFALTIIDSPPYTRISKAFIIAGSDARGTAYGVFNVSEKIGVSPWAWWADAPVKRTKALVIEQSQYISRPPSVKYRGIFINDEDWGLQPWAAKTYEPETGDIGPKTYAKVFELLLRLKANLIWPAMHPSTQAFYHYPLNKEVAQDYGIIIGSSHAEPMLRNNVSEWDSNRLGHFNYISNKANVYRYWEDRIKETNHNDVVYTMGMRGIHDGQMEGISNVKEAVPLLEQIFKDQRALLEKYTEKSVTDIPQVFTAYKEVLDIYDNGLKVPDDVTIVWPDDNYGYIQRLSNGKESKRGGGSGVYYHASYWGRPHDYLWLSTTHPSLIREEMIKAYKNNARRIWVLNVGDIKPAEYDIQFFLDMAFDVRPFTDSRYAKQHLCNWATSLFGLYAGEHVAATLWNYYQLAFERRPEFMGWSQTEPITSITGTRYNHFYYGDEGQRRINAYDTLEKQAKTLALKIDRAARNAYYELVYYPVVCAAYMNKKFLYRDKAYIYAKQNRLSAYDYAIWSRRSYDSIIKETEYYNDKLAAGKWRNIMSMHPRDLPVFEPPEMTDLLVNMNKAWNIQPEGGNENNLPAQEDTSPFELPPFDRLNKQRYFIDIFLSDDKPVHWTALATKDWIQLSAHNGLLKNEEGKKQSRLWVRIDWAKVPITGTQKGRIVFAGAGKRKVVNLTAANKSGDFSFGNKTFIENNGYLSIHAIHYARKSNGTKSWQLIHDLGYSGNSMESVDSAFSGSSITGDTSQIRSNAWMEYNFYTFSAGAAVFHFFSLPTFPLNNDVGMRYAVTVDGGPLQVIDFQTYGRSDEWKQNVLRNQAERVMEMPFLQNGKHVLRCYAVDAGVILDRVLIDIGGLKKAYGLIPESTRPADEKHMD